MRTASRSVSRDRSLEALSNSHEMSYRQLMAPDHLQARTNTTLRSFNRAVAMLAAPIAGTLADTWGNQLMLAVAAIIFAPVASAWPSRRSARCRHRRSGQHARGPVRQRQRGAGPSVAPNRRG